MEIENASLSWIDSNLPFSKRFRDIYYSREDELAESQHIFLKGNKLTARWAEMTERKSPFTIAEIGFGAGLNFLQTWHLFQKTQRKPARLHYIGFEKYPLSFDDLTRVHSRWLSLTKLSDQFRLIYPDHSSGCHRLHLGNEILLDLHFGDTLAQLENLPIRMQVDIWYLDGFTPPLNPEMWQPQLFQSIASHSKSDATLTSYSVAGSIRKHLQAAGFAVEKRPGHARKRHMLFAKNCQNKPSRESILNSYGSGKHNIERAALNQPIRSVLIIGAGIAGCSMAYSLAQRNWEVKVIDQAPGAATGASGNSQLALRCRLFQTDSELARFYLHSFLYTQRELRQLSKNNRINFHNCGVLQLVGAMNKQRDLNPNKLKKLYNKQVMQTLDVQSASRLANCQLTEAAYYFPLGGWIDGSLLCDTYLEHPSIDLITDQVVSSLKKNDNQWQLLDKEQKEIARAPIVVIANSYNASQFQQTYQLPLTTLPGQTSIISATDQSLSLATVVCGNRTVFPAIGNHHNLSASYRREDARLELRPDDDQQNLTGARSCFRGDYLSQVIQSARVTVRCNSKDNFPVVGKVPNVSRLQDHSMLGGHYGQIGKISSDYYLPGLYITAAHGSNGLATCPLSSEYLASLIDQEVTPFGQGIIGALDPARFIIREIRKKR